jgi:hypothetical protein
MFKISVAYGHIVIVLFVPSLSQILFVPLMGVFCSQTPPPSEHWSSNDFLNQFNSLKLPEAIKIRFVQKCQPNDNKVIDVYLDPAELKQIQQKLGYSTILPVVAFLLCGSHGLLLFKRELNPLDLRAIVDKTDWQCEICYDLEDHVTRLWSCPRCFKSICFPCQNKRILLNTHELCPFCRQKY